MKKILILLFLLVITSLLISSSHEEIKALSIRDLEIKEFVGNFHYFTLEGLKSYNGKDGKPVYVSVEGKIYDLSYLPKWLSGRHQNMHDAGVELTYAIKELSPHGISKIIDKGDPVGLLIIPFKELSKYYGSEDNSVYVGALGRVYDFSRLGRWKTGEHMNRHDSGQELTYYLTTDSPHGIKNLERAEAIGILGFTMEDLKNHNGKETKPVYVAAQGKVYDFTRLGWWVGGEHMNRHEAGFELTYELLHESPHGIINLNRAEAIGILIFSPEEITKYNGENGNKSYVSYENLVYDISKLENWPFEKGMDVTDLINKNSESVELLERAMIIGFLLRN